MELVASFLGPDNTKKVRVIQLAENLCFPHGYFDGEATNSMGGVGFTLYLNRDYFFYKLGCGPSTNTRAELLAL